jgi:hypothetical protein
MYRLTVYWWQHIRMTLLISVENILSDKNVTIDPVCSCQYTYKVTSVTNAVNQSKTQYIRKYNYGKSILSIIVSKT